MGRKSINAKSAKRNRAVCGKGGFTLAELCVVLALVAICSAMIVSFAAEMNKFSTSSQESYQFLEDSANLRDELSKWIAENDTAGVVFSAEDRELTKDGAKLTFTGGENLQTIGDIEFETNDSLIKCTISQKDGDGQAQFVFALRCATCTPSTGGVE